MRYAYLVIIVENDKPQISAHTNWGSAYRAEERAVARLERDGLVELKKNGGRWNVYYRLLGNSQRMVRVYREREEMQVA